MEEKYAYVTLLSSWDYLLAVLVLNKSLILSNSKYPLVVGVTEDIYDLVSFYLEKENILFKQIPNLEYSNEIKEKWGEDNSVLKTAPKIALFNFLEFDKLVYIDADVIIRKNMDELFLYPDGSLLVADGTILSGLIVYQPNNHNVQAYYSLMQIFNWLDGDLFSEIFFPCRSNNDYRIPDKYSKLITSIDLNDDEFDIEDIKCIQFVYIHKPWKYKKLEDFQNVFYQDFFKNANRDRIFQEYFELLKPYQIKYPELLRGLS